jgi:phasin family protein
MEHPMSTEKNWFDPNTYIEMMKSADMTKMFEGATVPGFDTEAVTEAQKKNVQAFVDANRVAAEGYQSLFKKQVEVMQSSITEMTDAMKEASTTPMSPETAEKRMEAAKAQFEKGVAVFTDLSESARKANEDAFAIIRARFTEGVTEVREMTEAAMKTAA